MVDCLVFPIVSSGLSNKELVHQQGQSFIHRLVWCSVAGVQYEALVLRQLFPGWLEPLEVKTRLLVTFIQFSGLIDTVD